MQTTKQIALALISVALISFSMSYSFARFSHVNTVGLTEAEANFANEIQRVENQEGRDLALSAALIGDCRDGDTKVAAGFAALCRNSRWIVPGAGFERI